MGKRITQQARGKGSLIYRVRRKAYRYRVAYPPLNTKGNAKIIKLFSSASHSAPLIKIQIKNKDKNIIFYNLAFKGAVEGQNIEIDGKQKEGNIARLKNIKIGTRVYNIEITPGDGGKIIRSAGSSALVDKKEKDSVFILLPNKREKKLSKECRATLGEVAGEGLSNKPFLKAGKKFYLMKAKGRKWHRASAVKVNAVDHPFGGGRGKRIKRKIAKRNAPPGRKVGHIKPRRTGKKK